MQFTAACVIVLQEYVKNFRFELIDKYTRQLNQFSELSFKVKVPLKKMQNHFYITNGELWKIYFCHLF